MNKAKLSIQLRKLIFEDTLGSWRMRMMLAKALDVLEKKHTGWVL